MIKGQFPLDKFENTKTPFYYYDMELLDKTINTVKTEANKYGYHIHYALKANFNPTILKRLQEAGFGADCVSGGEVKASLDAGFKPESIVYAGVGKSDWEIELSIKAGIFCFNVESIPEMEIINSIAEKNGVVASVAIRVNPDVDARTHSYITTGLKENKFGIHLSDLENAINKLAELKNLKLIGLHFHIGSQITDMTAFQHLCVRVNAIQDELEAKNIKLSIINVGGGLGINYQHPNHVPVADFEGYFKTFHSFLKLREGQTLHFELGRSIVANCGSLITKVLYVKEGANINFAIVDGSMTELIRPALYKAFHLIENISSTEEIEHYDVVGPVCESSDVFGKAVPLNKTKRGDLIALRSAGAYGEAMACQYNLRKLPESCF